MVTNAARAINDDAFVEGALPALAAVLEAPGFTNEPLLRRAINANAFIADQQSAIRLTKFAADPQYPGLLRAEALNALSVWQSPSVYDRVSGMYRGERSGDARQAVAALQPYYETLLQAPDALVREAAANAVGRLGVRAAAATLAAQVHSDPAENVRRSALDNLHRLAYPGLADVVFASLKDDAQSVRRAALGLISELEIPAADKVAMYAVLLQKGTYGEQQQAYKSLARIDSAKADELIAAHLQKLKAGEIAPEVQLELVQTAEASNSPQVQQLLQEYQQAKTEKGIVAQYLETLKGGDAHMGKLFFFYNTTAQCIRCHVVGDFGSPVGPELTDIGNRLTRYQLVQAMVDPGARVAPGFGRTRVVLHSGEVLEGQFTAETDSHIRLVTDAGEEKIIPRSEIAGQTFSGSGMPPMGLMLEKENVRDIVEFLANQKGNGHSVSH